MRRLAAVGITVLALAVGGAAVVTAPDDDAVSGPIARIGPVGQRVTGRIFDATVTSLAFGDGLRTTDGRTVATPGIWLRVTVRMTPHLHNVAPDNSTVRVDGTTYAATSETSDLEAGLQNPGVTVRGDLVFELPRSIADRPDAEVILDTGTLVADQITVVPIHPDRIPRLSTVRITPYSLVATDSG